MDNKEISDEYKEALINKALLDNKVIDIDDLSLEQIEYINNLYKLEIAKTAKDINHLKDDIARKRKELGLD